MGLAVVGLAAFHAVYDIEGHGLFGIAENGGLVHVIPETANPHVQKIGVQVAIPLADLTPGEVGEHAGSRPDRSNVNRAIRIFNEVLMFHAIVVGLVSGLLCEMEIDDGNDLETIIREIAHHLFESRKAFSIDGEAAIFVFVIDVEVKHVAGDFSGAKFGGNVSHLFFRKIAVAGLLVSENKLGRKGRAAYQRGVVLEDLLGRRTVEEIVVEFSAIGAEGVGIAALFAKLEAAAVRVVQEDAIGVAGAYGKKKWDAFVQRIGALGPVHRVGVPHGKSMIAMIDGTRFVSQSEIVFVGRHRLPNAK